MLTSSRDRTSIVQRKPASYHRYLLRLLLESYRNITKHPTTEVQATTTSVMK